MKNLLISLFFLGHLFLYSSCLPNDNVSAACYQSDPLDELPWLKKVVEDFDKPKSGPFTLSLVEYKGEAYFVLGSPVFSSPMNYIYNCGGKTLPQLGIDFKKFIEEKRFIKIIKEKDR
jgi:hypothetical protein